MNRVLYVIALLCFGGLSLFAGVSMAEQGQQRPKPDFSAMADALIVPQDTLMPCLGPVPAPGHRAERPNPENIATCLTHAGYQVSTEAVEAALTRSEKERS